MIRSTGRHSKGKRSKERTTEREKESKNRLKGRDMKRFIEITSDKGIEYHSHASDNSATYILTSAYAHDLYDDYVDKYDRLPSSRWFNRHFNFKNNGNI